MSAPLPTRSLLLLALLFTGCMIVSSGYATEPNFNRDVQPILSDHCYQCHGPDERSREADLRLDQESSLLSAAGDPESIDESELLRRILSKDSDEVMPPPDAKNDLTNEEKQTIHDWIKSGAKWEGHWSFIRPQRPALPKTDTSEATVANEIDRFILKRLETKKLPPNEEATPERLLRRVTLDLTGVPPTLAELDNFQSEPSDDAYREIVERLLSSPRFGERMSMEWLDAARYADTNGYQGDRERTMWPWRDWVIDAINQNMPYDEFTVWQLAGDLLPHATDEQKLATGFCRNHMINGEGGRIAEENRVEYIFDQIETVGTVWMGLTVQCCRCHDHKFEPLAQAEYYQLFAFFNQTPVNGGGGDPQAAPNLVVTPELQRDVLRNLEARFNKASKSLEELESNNRTEFEKDSELEKAFSQNKNKRNGDEWKLIEEHFADNRDLLAAIKRFRDQKREYDEARKRLPKVMIMADRADKLRETFILDKGLYNQPKEKVSAGTPAFLPAISSDKVDRLALARWLVSPEHPLTARVTVNRFWQTFFGVGLVKTTEDFGVQGEKPTHPELLDWLAVEFAESGWDAKHLIRLIVTSSAYRRSARASAQQLETDPENRLLARGPRMRMPAWMIRDHALFVSQSVAGQIGGPSVKGYQPDGVWEEASFGNKKYQRDDGEKLYRRSLYTYWRRIVGPTMFFDMAKRQTCSVRPGQTNTPLHALITLNDTTYVEAARLMAIRVMQTEEEANKRVALAFRLATGRHPNDEEVALLSSRLNELQTHYTDNADAADKLLQVGEARLKRDFSQSELASYSTICLMILNLDEALCK